MDGEIMDTWRYDVFEFGSRLLKVCSFLHLLGKMHALLEN